MTYDNSGQPRRGINLRVILAIGMAIFAMAGYMCHTQVNPITQEKQHVTITPDQEIALGLQAAQQVPQQMGAEVPPGDPQTQQVQRIGNKVVSGSVAHSGPWQYQFHLLGDQKTVNAFAFPGGQVFITKGLLDRLQNEAQLAGVLGHECGHVIERHSAQQMAEQHRDQMLVLATGVGASDDRSNHGQMVAMAAAMAAQMSELHYSRKDESQADTWGCQLMSEAGYDPRAMIEVMNILEDATKDMGHEPEILQSHPEPEHRKETIQAYIDKHFPSGVPASLSLGNALR